MHWSHGTSCLTGYEGVPYFDDVILDDPAGKGYAAPLRIAFDLDGTMYTIIDWLLGADPILTELATIDLNTGEVTVIAKIVNHFCDPEIDACGSVDGQENPRLCVSWWSSSTAQERGRIGSRIPRHLPNRH